MHKALADFFDAHRSKTRDHKRSAHDQLDPIMDVCAAAEQHVLDLETKLQKAELAVHDHALDHSMEWMQTRLRDTKLRAASLRTASREFARSLVELERAFDDGELQIAASIQAAASTASTGSGGTVPANLPPS